MNKSKTMKILEHRNRILQTLSAYAYLAAEWEPAKEGDYDSFVQAIDLILEELVYENWPNPR